MSLQVRRFQTLVWSLSNNNPGCISWNIFACISFIQTWPRFPVIYSVLCTSVWDQGTKAGTVHKWMWGGEILCDIPSKVWWDTLEKCVRELKKCYVGILQYAENENEANQSSLYCPLYVPHVVFLIGNSNERPKEMFVCIWHYRSTVRMYKLIYCLSNWLSPKYIVERFEGNWRADFLFSKWYINEWRFIVTFAA